MDDARKREIAHLTFLAMVASLKDDTSVTDADDFVEALCQPDGSFFTKPNSVSAEEWRAFATVLYADATPEHAVAMPPVLDEWYK